MILLVSNSRDFAVDYLVAVLRDRSLPYYRLDLDLLAADRVSLDPIVPARSIDQDGRQVQLDASNLWSVFYHAPTHLRESSGGRYPPEEVLARHQWAAFARSLTVFDHCPWVNHLQRTYLAENNP